MFAVKGYVYDGLGTVHVFNNRNSTAAAADDDCLIP